MKTVKELYDLWSTDLFFDQGTRDELLGIAKDEKDITERFYKNLEFGTGGLRGFIGAGTNRMNVYTVALATEGFARYIDGLDLDQKDRVVTVSYDSRRFSKEFAMITSLVFATHGIKVFLSNELRPTPMLSYAVRHFKAVGGVMITASHNPAKYNGYKAYGSDGGQMPPEAASVILDSMGSIEDIRTLSWISEKEAFDKGLITYFGSEFDDDYTAMLKKLIINQKAIDDNKDMKIVFTPLHGAGNKPVRKILREIGFENVFVVPEQEMPDPNFSTVEFPNPEERSALKLAIELAGKEDADLLVATDPDGDRTGLAVKGKDGEYIILTGNQIGLLLLEYILKAKKESGSLSAASFAITTIVSTKLSRLIAKEYGIKLFEVLTGFKFIGEVIKDYDENGDMNFEFGFEESYGFLAGKDVRDKDAIVTVMLIAEMAASARNENKNLYDKLLELFEHYGYAAENTVSIMLEGKEGIEKIQKTMSLIRSKSESNINGIEVESVSDYLASRKTDFVKNEITVLELEKSDVLLFALDGLDWFCVRPSGTEPKIKIYFGIYGMDKAKCEARLEEVSSKVIGYIKSLL